MLDEGPLRRVMRSAPRLVLITDLSMADETRSIEALRAILDAVPPDLVAVGLRDHSATARRRRDLGLRLVATARPLGARVLVHDRIDLARAIDADGVQLGARSIEVEEARALLPKESVVAKSCHDAAELRRAVEEGVDWVTLSSLFSSPTKGAPLGVERFSEMRARAASSVPVVALGGIDATNVDAARRAGANGVAVIRAWLATEDAAKAARALVAPFVGR